MAKRPHGDVERTKEDLDEEFYAGIAQMRLEAGREMQRWGYRPQIILPLPLFLPPPSVPARVLPGAEALAAASYATVVHAVLDLVVNASSPAAGAASSSAPDAYEWLPEEDLLDSDEETEAMMIEDEDVYQDVDAVPGVRIPRSMPRGAFFQKVIMPWVDENVHSFIAL